MSLSRSSPSSKESSRPKRQRREDNTKKNRYESKNHRENYNRSSRDNSSERDRHRNNKSKKEHSTREDKSDFCRHIIYQDLPIRKQYENEFLEQLKDKMNRLAPVDYVSLVQRHGDKADIGLGFRFDSDAISYLEGNKSLEITLQSNRIHLYPKKSKAFDHYYNRAKEIKIEKQRERQIETRYRYEEQKKKRNKSHSKDRQRRQKSKDKQRERERTRNQKRRRSSSSKRSQRRSQRRSHRRSSRRSSKKSDHMVTFRIFGIPLKYTKSDVVNAIKNHRGGHFDLQQPVWQQAQKARYLKIKVSERSSHQFQKAVQEYFNEKLPVVLKCPSDTSSIRKSLRDYQLKISYPQKVHPLNVYRSLNNYGEIIQLVVDDSQQNMQYYVTFGSLKSVRDVKNLKVQGSGITIESMRDGQMVYRPKEQLKGLMGEEVKRTSRS